MDDSNNHIAKQATDFNQFLADLTNKYDEIPKEGHQSENDSIGRDEEDIVDMNYLLENHQSSKQEHPGQTADVHDFSASQPLQPVATPEKSSGNFQTHKYLDQIKSGNPAPTQGSLGHAKYLNTKTPTKARGSLSSTTKTSDFKHRFSQKKAPVVYDNLEDDPNLKLEKDGEGLAIDQNLSSFMSTPVKEEEKTTSAFKKRLLRKMNTAVAPLGSDGPSAPLQGTFTEELDSKLSLANTAGDLEQIDQIQEQLSVELQACGFPDCGNLRSTKRKDVKQRIKCLMQMLKQRKKDIEFRSGLHDKSKKQETDTEALVDKLKRKEARISYLDKELFNMQNQLKEKDDQMRQIRMSQRTTIKDKAANHTQLEQKLVRTECDLKKTKQQLLKMQDQLKRNMGSTGGGGHAYTGYSVDVKHRITDLGINSNIDPSSKAGQARVALEWKEHLEKGFNKQLEALREENKLLKQNLLTVQDFLVDSIKSSLPSLQGLVKSRGKLQDYHRAFEFSTIQSTLTTMQFALPQSPATSMQCVQTFRKNLEKFKTFSSMQLEILKDYTAFMMQQPPRLPLASPSAQETEESPENPNFKTGGADIDESMETPGFCTTARWGEHLKKEAEEKILQQQQQNHQERCEPFDRAGAKRQSSKSQTRQRWGKKASPTRFNPSANANL